MTATVGQYNRCDVPTHATNRQLIRQAYRLLSVEGKTRALRQARHAWLRGLIRIHLQGQDLASTFHL